MIASFPVGGDHLTALAAYPGMPELFHHFARALTDANVNDLGPGTVPYDPPAWKLPLRGPAEVTFPVVPFGVRRVHITVPPGEYACFDTFQFNDQQASWRPGWPCSCGSTCAAGHTLPRAAMRSASAAVETE